VRVDRFHPREGSPLCHIRALNQGSHIFNFSIGANVHYRLFYIDRSAEPDPTPTLHKLTRLEFDSMGATIKAGCALIKRGSIVWRIDSLSGFVMERRDIETECTRRVLPQNRVLVGPRPDEPEDA
jgi:hypothetical protein